ncbi:MAG: hypothetical protein NUV75_12530, partial [Gallionella sp.]|nr:hypothetical protein [Gallionella sp.]
AKQRRQLRAKRGCDFDKPVRRFVSDRDMPPGLGTLLVMCSFNMLIILYFQSAEGGRHSSNVVPAVKPAVAGQAATAAEKAPIVASGREKREFFEIAFL